MGPDIDILGRLARSRFRLSVTEQVCAAEGEAVLLSFEKRGESRRGNGQSQRLSVERQGCSSSTRETVAPRCQWQVFGFAIEDYMPEAPFTRVEGLPPTGGHRGLTQDRS